MASQKKREPLRPNEVKLNEVINAGKLQEVKALLSEKDVRVDCLDESGMTPLQHAAYRGNAEICHLLLAHGADVNSNHHDHDYSALIFGALSGKADVVRLLLQAGARVNHTNSVGRTAAQMAGFVGQHQVVSIINNFFSREDLEYYAVPRALETEPKLPPHLAGTLYNLINNSNLHPVKVSLYLKSHPEILDEKYKVCKVLDILLEKMMKCSSTNEVMALKFHYLATVIRHMEKSRQANDGKLDVWLKHLLRSREPDNFPEAQEKLIRSTLKDFPYVDSQLLQQLVRSLASVAIGDSPTALSMLNQGINGQRFASEDDENCSTCDELGAKKKCSACKMVHYCNQDCQKLHWFTHKKFCKRLAERYVELEEQRRKMEEEKKKEEEEKAKQEALKEKERTEENENVESGDGKKEEVNEEKEEKEESDDLRDKLQKISTGAAEETQETTESEEDTERTVSMTDVNVSLEGSQK